MDDGKDDVIFERQIDKVARAIQIKGNEAQATPEVIQQFLDFGNYVGALLMRHEGVCFSVYGENMVVPLLISAFGANGVLTLVEQGALKFWLQKTAVVHFVKPQKGLKPLASSVLTTPAHSDPEESIAESLRRSTINFEAGLLRRLKRDLADAYVDAGASFAPHAVEFGYQGYSLGRFRFAGLDPEVPLDELDEQGVRTLARLAHEMHDLSLIANLRMNTIDEFAITRVCDDSVDRLKRGGRLERAFRRVFEIEGVPDLSSLFRSGALNVREVPKLRAKHDAEKFRRWVRAVSLDPHASDAGSEYLAAIAAGAGFWSTPAGRVAKTLTVSAVSGGTGAALGGPAGALLGATAGPTILGVGFDLLDEFVLSGLLSGWQPRNFFEKIVYSETEKSP